MNIIRFLGVYILAHSSIAGSTRRAIPKRASGPDRPAEGNYKISLDPIGKGPRRTSQQTEPFSAPTATLSPGLLDSALQSALGQQGAYPTVVIVNETPTLDPAQAQAIEAASSAYARASNETITFNDIDDLLLLSAQLSDAVSTLYKTMPNPNNYSFNTTTSTLEKLKLGVQFYAQVRAFVSAVNQNQVIILNDIQFIQGKVYQLNVTQQDMLRFYNSDVGYALIKEKAQPFEGSDPKFAGYWSEIDELAANFGDDVRSALTTVVTLVQSLDSFQTIIKGVAAHDFSKTIDLSALSLVDDIIMALYNLLQVKVLIEQSISNSKEGLLSLKTYRNRIKETLNNIDLLVDYYQMSDKRLRVGVLQENLFEYHKSAVRLDVVLAVLFALIVWY